MIKISTYKYKIYPDKEQKTLLKQMMIQQCEIYNCAIEERNYRYVRDRTKLSYFTQTKSLKEIEFLGSDSVSESIELLVVKN